MAIIQVLLAALARSAGRILNTAVGWATTMIFGRVPERRQVYVSIMTFGSLVWIAVIVGIAFPSVGTYEEWEVLFRQRLLLRLVAETKKRGGSGDGVSVSEAHGGRHPAWRGPGVEGASSVGSSEAR